MEAECLLCFLSPLLRIFFLTAINPHIISKYNEADKYI
jgi:hypothetical protein